MAVPVVVIVGAIAWATTGWTQRAAELAGVDKFTVDRQTFSVVLKEKGELKASNSTDIVCEVEGRSTIITLIPEGTAVKEGDLLVELASDQIEDRIRQEELKEANAITAFEAAKTELEIQRDRNASDIRKAELEIELNGLALEKYNKGDWAQALKDAKIAIDQAKIARERRKEDFEAAKELVKKNFITKTQYDEDEFAFKRAGWELEKAELALRVLEAYTHVADLRQRQSDLDEAKKECDRVRKNAEAEELKKVRTVEGQRKELELIQDQLAKLRNQAEKCRIHAPTQGFVVYYSGGGRHFMSGDSQIKEGATVHERQILLSLPDTAEMMVLVRVHEAKTNQLHLGQPAVITVEGLPGKQFTGSVTKIAVLADSQNRWLNPDLKEYETEITLDPTDVPLKPGVTAHAEILVETVEDSLAVPVQSVYSKGGRRYVFQASRADIMPAPITLGAIGTEWAQILDGLSGGEQILLAFSDEQKRLVPDVSPEERRNGPGGFRPQNGGPVPGYGNAAQPNLRRSSETPDRAMRQGDETRGRMGPRTSPGGNMRRGQGPPGGRRQEAGNKQSDKDRVRESPSGSAGGEHRQETESSARRPRSTDERSKKPNPTP